ncbi:MAG: riboflavin synthase [Candidatus Thiodiazotropha sp. (ex Ctena orbiculata)]|uniref:Riboflavin synthase n=1 Tax=Candidatus Thiodiazotropha taylori TaxID=2792791 RepID=A0A944QU73_9GAMM|nr:riboflavin synthase [Candidatus Thiodiazotropha taylori]PUB87437.1 MAG: riboflavin synthase [gamma proteobacterium symbiont of Ctena orbiculata]MBT2988609.1 riboflavin synthase [Candidatus Thiodiazotropha taylori]MBT2996822.1 riboflavin synthase [Candidatus Thiodiazotropha taylori]MBT3002055.1 riboflavin synthase [Candidatus Thiodiazotropha taylori]
MFTGIIQAVGNVAGMESRQGDLRLSIQCGQLDMNDVALGDSIATNGICLTVIDLSGDGFSADVSRETLSITTLEKLHPGSPVNLEKALTLSTPLGGHLVSGHVDGVGRVVERRDDARSIRFRIEAPAALARYIAHKGSICVDGVSLTVNGVEGARFELNIVPHTLTKTIMENYRVGSEVNLEVDLVARYLERLVLGDRETKNSVSGVTETLLKERGFIAN